MTATYLRTCSTASLAMCLMTGTATWAGPFTDPGIGPSEGFAAWADTVDSFTPTSSGSPVSGGPSGLGPADGVTVSLGDLDASQIAASVPPGQITLQFTSGHIYDGPGWDFAVFENATDFGGFVPFPFLFAELGYVEVSSDGVQFARFPATSLNVPPGSGIPGDTEIDAAFGTAFATINRTNVHNLAGASLAPLGTKFDLTDLSGDPLVLSGNVDLDSIEFVRIVDVPGDGSFLDQFGNGILDAWPTAGTGGVDLDAVAARHFVPEPASLLPLALGWGWLLRGNRKRRTRAALC